MLLALPAGPEAGHSASKRAYSGPGAGGAGYGPREGDGGGAGLETVRRVLALHEVPPEIEHATRYRKSLPK